MQRKKKKKSRSLDAIARELSAIVVYLAPEDVELCLRLFEYRRKNPNACLCKDCFEDWLRSLDLRGRAA